MILPTWIIIFLPKSMQDKQVQKRWDARTDFEIIDAYYDAHSWIRLVNGMTNPDKMLSVSEDCDKRLDKYINPQIKKRKLDIKKVMI